MTPIGRFLKASQFIQPVKCLFNYVAQNNNFSIDLTNDGGYYFEYQLLNFMPTYYNAMKTYVDGDYPRRSKDFNFVYDTMGKKYLELFAEQYRFTQKEYEISDSFLSSGFSSIKFDGITNKLHEGTKELDLKDIQIQNVTCDVREFNYTKPFEKKIVFLDFTFDNLFKAEKFENLLDQKTEDLQSNFLTIKKNVFQIFQNDITEIYKFYENDPNIEIHTVQTSLKKFMKLALINNDKNLFNYDEKDYLYKAEKKGRF